MSNSNKVVDRIRKLLRLAESTNAAEAALARQHADRLLARYGISEGDVAVGDEAEFQAFADSPLDTGASIPDWKQAIAGAVAELHGAMCLVSEPRAGELRKLVICGRRSHIEPCATMYKWLVQAIERRATQDGERLARSLRRAGMGRRWLNSYRRGAAGQIELRLERETADHRAALGADPATSTAIAIPEDAVDQWVDDNVEAKPAVEVDTDVDRVAYRMGSAAGRWIPLRPEPIGDA